MSIVRIGLAENEEFAEGYDAIFGKQDEKAKPKPEEKKTDAKAGAEELEKRS